MLETLLSIESTAAAFGVSDDRIQIAASVVAATAILMLSSGTLTRIVAAHPSLERGALGILILIGLSLIAEGFEVEIPPVFVWTAIAIGAPLSILLSRKRR